MGDLILVVDIGGGTTDFTLIAVTEANGELSLNRVAVGEHILLGGDNIDLALAGVVAHRLAEKGTRIDSRQHLALWANCRVAKEKLLEPGAKAKEQPGHHSRQGHGPGGRHDQGVAPARRYRARAGRRLPARGREHRNARPPAPRRACRNWACPMPPTPPSRGTWRAFCASRPPPRSTARCGAARAAWPAPRTCSSTEACSTPRWSASGSSRL